MRTLLCDFDLLVCVILRRALLPDSRYPRKGVYATFAVQREQDQWFKIMFQSYASQDDACWPPGIEEARPLAS